MKLKIKTLTFQQLVSRWPQYSAENILELANEGYFGAYVKPCTKRQGYDDIAKSLKFLYENKQIDEKAKKSYVELNETFLKFISERTDLLEEKPGFVRLATALEVKIFQLCASGSINQLMTKGKIYFQDWNNSFGFVKEDDKYICESYFLVHTANEVRKTPLNYKGHYVKEDLFFFVDQVEQFESKAGMIFSLDEKENSSSIEIQSQIDIDEKNSFKINGDFCEIIFKGEPLPSLKKIKGLQYIGYLLKNPNKRVHACDIEYHSVPSLSENVYAGSYTNLENENIFLIDGKSTEKMIDKKTKKYIESTIDDIDEKIAIGDKTPEEIEDLKEQKKKCQNFLNGAIGKNGETRNMRDENDKARLRVRDAINTALEKIGKHSSALYGHLSPAIKKGLYCTYHATDEIKWS